MSITKTYFTGLAVWLSLTMFYCYQYILRIIPNVMMPELTARYNVGAADFGTFAGIYYIGYVVVHIPIGLALARFGGKIIIPSCVILASIGLVPLGYSDSWNYVLIGRLLIGVGSSAAIIGGLQIFKMTFPKYFTQMLGMMVCLGLITAVHISKSISSVICATGLQNTISILVIGGLGLALFLFLLIPNTPSEVRNQKVLSDLKIIICNYKLMIVSVLAGLMVGPLEGFADAWGTSSLMSIHNIDRISATNSISLILTGMCIGCIILPFIADKTQSHYTITLCSAITMCGCFIYLLLGNGTIKNINIVCSLIGISCAYQVVIIAKISAYVPERLSGIAAAVGNMVVMAFGSIFHKTISGIIESHDGAEIIDNVRIYSKEAYIQSISIIPIAMLISIVCFAVIIASEYYSGYKKNLAIS